MTLKIHYGCSDLKEVSVNRYQSEDKQVEVLITKTAGKITQIKLKQGDQITEIPYSDKDGYSISEIYIPQPYTKPPARFNDDAKKAWEQCRGTAAVADESPPVGGAPVAAQPPKSEPRSTPVARPAPTVEPSDAQSAGLKELHVLGRIENLVRQDYASPQYDANDRQRIIAAVRVRLTQLYGKQKTYQEKHINAAYEGYRHEHQPKAAGATVQRPQDAAAVPVVAPTAVSGSAEPLRLDESHAVGRIENMVRQDYVAPKYDADDRQRIIATVRANLPKQKLYTEEQISRAYGKYRDKHPPAVAKVAEPTQQHTKNAAAIPAAVAGSAQPVGLDESHTLGRIETMVAKDYASPEYKVDDRQRIIEAVRVRLTQLYGKQKTYQEKHINTAYESYKYEHPPKSAQAVSTGRVDSTVEEDKQLLIDARKQITDLKWVQAALKNTKALDYEKLKRIGDILDIAGIDSGGDKLLDKLHGQQFAAVLRELSPLVKSSEAMKSSYVGIVVSRVTQAATSLKAAIAKSGRSSSQADFDVNLKKCKSILDETVKYKALLLQFGDPSRYTEMIALVDQLQQQVKSLTYSPPQPAIEETPKPADELSIDMPGRIDTICPHETQRVVANLKSIDDFFKKYKNLQQRFNRPEFAEVMERMRSIQTDMLVLKRCSPNGNKVRAIENAIKALQPKIQEVHERIVQLLPSIEDTYSSVAIPPQYDTDIAWLDSPALAGPSGTYRVNAASVEKYLSSIFGAAPKGKVGTDHWREGDLCAVATFKQLKGSYDRAQAILQLIANAEKGIRPAVAIKPIVESPGEKIGRLERIFYKECADFEREMALKTKRLRTVPARSSLSVLEVLRDNYASLKTDLGSKYDALLAKHREILDLEEGSNAVNKSAQDKRESKLQDVQLALQAAIRNIDNRIQDADELHAKLSAAASVAPPPRAKVEDGPTVKPVAEDTPKTREKLLKTKLLEAKLDQLAKSLVVSSDESHVWFNAPDVEAFKQGGSIAISLIREVYKKEPAAAIIAAAAGDTGNPQLIELSLTANKLSVKTMRDSRTGNPDILIFFTSEARDVYFRQMNPSAETPPQKAAVIAPASAKPVDVQLKLLRDQASALKSDYDAAKKETDVVARIQKFESLIARALTISSDANELSVRSFELMADADRIKSDVDLLRTEIFAAKSSLEAGPEMAVHKLRSMPALQGIASKISYSDGIISIADMDMNKCPQLCPEIVRALGQAMPTLKVQLALIHVAGTSAQPMELSQILEAHQISSLSVVEPDASDTNPRVSLKFAMNPQAAVQLKKEAEQQNAIIGSRLRDKADAADAAKQHSIDQQRTALKTIVDGLHGSTILESKVGSIPIQAFRIPLSDLGKFKADLGSIRSLLNCRMDRPVMILSNNPSGDDEIDEVAIDLAKQQHVVAYSTGMVSEKYVYVILHGSGSTVSTKRLYEGWQKDSFKALLPILKKLDSTQQATEQKVQFPKELVKGLRINRTPPIQLKTSALYSGTIHGNQFDKQLKNVDSIARIANSNGAKVLIMYHTAPTSEEKDTISSLAKMNLDVLRGKYESQNTPVAAHFFRASNITENNGPNIIHYIMLMPGDDEATVLKRYKAYIDSVQPH